MVVNDLDDEQKQLYSRLYVSGLDLDLASYSLSVIMKTGGTTSLGKNTDQSINIKLLSHRLWSSRSRNQNRSLIGTPQPYGIQTGRRTRSWS
jgi:hypothetical protein